MTKLKPILILLLISTSFLTCRTSEQKSMILEDDAGKFAKLEFSVPNHLDTLVRMYDPRGGDTIQAYLTSNCNDVPELAVIELTCEQVGVILTQNKSQSQEFTRQFSVQQIMKLVDYWPNIGGSDVMNFADSITVDGHPAALIGHSSTIGDDIGTSALCYFILEGRVVILRYFKPARMSEAELRSKMKWLKRVKIKSIND